MTKNKWLLVSVLSAISSVGGIAAAQPGGPGHFAKLDTNADGVVTTAEFQARVLDRWTKADANQDGKVTADEIKAQFAAHKQERFTKRDANSNGVLERAEVQRMTEGMFAKLDADKSGSLSQAELTSAHAKRGGKAPRGAFKGKTCRSEDVPFKGLPGDADKDGAVTKAEATAGVEKMAARIDANGDGTLTKDELGRGHGHHHRGSRSDAE